MSNSSELPFVVRAPRCEPPIHYRAAPVDSTIGSKHQPPQHIPLPSQTASRRTGPPSLSLRCTQAEPRLHQFTEHMLRLLLEACDGRRPVATLATMADSGPINLVRSISRGTKALPGRELGPAKLNWVRTKLVGPDDVEFYGTYLRRSRSFAIAGHLTRSPRGAWRVSALQLA